MKALSSTSKLALATALTAMALLGGCRNRSADQPANTGATGTTPDTGTQTAPGTTPPAATPGNTSPTTPATPPESGTGNPATTPPEQNPPPSNTPPSGK